MSVLEAWAYRLPVLMTAECNLPEGFEIGAAIRVTNEPDALADQLATVLFDTDLPPLGEAGRSLVEDRFSWSSVAARHLEVYRWMVNGGKPPACLQLAGA
jgi:poly(glycerol-phosphate) alpha-glucosyltransferase